MRLHPEGWERPFWHVFGHSGDPIQLIDQDRRFVDLNRPAEILFGRTRDELIGTRLTDVGRRAELPRAAVEWDEFLRTGEYTGARFVIRPDGAEVPVGFAGTLTTVEGRRLAVYVLARADSPVASKVGAPRDRGCRLSSRESEVVTLIALGHETPEIARRLSVETSTVRTHVRNAMEKVSARTRAQLVALTLADRLETPYP